MKKRSLCIILSIALLIVLVLFYFILNQKNPNKLLLSSLNCSLNNEKYTVNILKDTSISCAKCKKDTTEILNYITNNKSIYEITKEIKEYFSSNGGICE